MGVWASKSRGTRWALLGNGTYETNGDLRD